MEDSATVIRRRILAGEGIVASTPFKKVRKRVVPVSKKNSGKTLAMLLIESQFAKPLEELLDGSLNGEEVAQRLLITRSTVSRWRKRLGIKVQQEKES